MCLKLILAQVRAKRETTGDLRAQVAANNTGIRRFGSLLDRLGMKVVANYIDELIAYTEGTHTCRRWPSCPKEFTPPMGLWTMTALPITLCTWWQK